MYALFSLIMSIAGFETGVSQSSLCSKVQLQTDKHRPFKSSEPFIPALVKQGSIGVKYGPDTNLSGVYF